jgi:hypothetical protein
MLPVQVNLVGVEIVTEWPEQAVTYEQYLNDYAAHPPKGDHGPWAAVYVSSESNLAAICHRMGLHHLYWDGYQCPVPAPHNYGYLGGFVFNLSVEERARLHVSPELYGYRFYLPVDLSKSIEWSGMLHDESEKALATAQTRQHGVCVNLGAGAMPGYGIRSNAIHIGVSTEGDKLTVTPMSSQGASNQFGGPHNYCVNPPAGGGPEIKMARASACRGLRVR